MQKYQEKPIPLVIRQQSDQKYIANPEALQFFASIKGKVAIISVAGMYRTGKSFLLNTMLLNIKKGFAVGPTINPKTKGIWVWGKPLNFKNDRNEIVNVLVMDSQGLGSTEQDINHDLRLFSITLLLSSTFLYNSVGSIDENAIDSLGLVLRLCEHLKQNTFNDFPDFHWILRDFSLALVGKDNSPLTTKMYLENCLNSQPGDSEVRNKIRDSIRGAFPVRQCVTFVRPLTNETDLQNLDKMELDQLRPEFVEQVLKFRKNIFKQIKVKTIKGKEVRGEMLCDLVNIYIQAINGKENDGLPVIETGWNYVCKRECEAVIEELEYVVEERIKQLKEMNPKNKKELSECKAALAKQIEKEFKSKTVNNDEAQKYMESLNEMIGKKFKKFESEVKRKNTQDAEIFLRKQFDSIDKRIKQSDFKNMGQLIKEFQMFYEYYRKKCPYKDQVETGLQFIMKKFSDSALILYKGVLAKKEAELQGFKAKITQASNDNLIREQRSKADKSSLQEKYAILESKFEQVTNQNKIISANFKCLEEQLQSKVHEAQQTESRIREQLEMENLRLRKKILQIEDSFKEIEFQRGQRISRLERQILLKQNQISHLRTEKEQSTAKIQQLSGNLQKQRQQKKDLIQQHTQQIEREKKERENVQKRLSNILHEKDLEISNLEHLIESKTEQIQRLSQEMNTKRRLITEQAQEEQKKEVLTLRNQIESLKQTLETQQTDLTLKIKKLEGEICQKDMKIKMQVLQIEKEKALLDQKLEFLQKELEEKNQKCIKLSEENNYYLGIFDEKQSELNHLSSELEQMRNNNEMNSEEMVLKLNTLNEEILQKDRMIKNQENELETSKESLRSKNKQIRELNELLQQKQAAQTEQVKSLKEANQKLVQDSSKGQKHAEQELDSVKENHRRQIEEQKHSAQISLVQLKNFYEMERQRLEKRILEERKKYEQSEAEIIDEISSKFKKNSKVNQQEITELKTKLDQVEEMLARTESEYGARVANLEEEKESQKRILSNRIESLERKYQDTHEELNTTENQYEEQRITLIKKIEGLNFEISRKEKEIMQAQSRKDSAEAIVAKKQAQLENMKKVMNQQIEFSLNKVSEIQAKYQKLNEEHMNMKIESEKQIALSKQRNQFLTSKLEELSKQKDVSSSKNLDKFDKQKISDLKEQIQRHKAEIIALESKLQSNRKAAKQTESNYRKQMMNLEKDNQFLQQKLEISQIKNTEMESKLLQKNENFMREVEDIRIKQQNERNVLQNQIEGFKQRLTSKDDQQNQIIWKLQKEIALLQEKQKFVQYQRDQTKKQLQQTEQRLTLTNNQLKKMTEKTLQDNEMKKNTFDRRFTNQLQVMKENMKVRTDEQEDYIKRMKEELKNFKDKNLQLQDKLHKAQKIRGVEKNLAEENDNLKKQKQQLLATHRVELTRENEDSRRKTNELEKRLRETERKNNEFIFTLEKQQAKWTLQKQNLFEKIKSLEENIEWQKQKNNQSKNDPNKNKKTQPLFHSQFAK